MKKEKMEEEEKDKGRKKVNVLIRFCSKWIKVSIRILNTYLIQFLIPCFLV